MSGLLDIIFLGVTKSSKTTIIINLLREIKYTNKNLVSIMNREGSRLRGRRICKKDQQSGSSFVLFSPPHVSDSA